MEEAEVLFAQRGRFAFLSVGEDMTAFDVHDGSYGPPVGAFFVNSSFYRWLAAIGIEADGPAGLG
jgi:hypothetical protein